MNNFIFTRYFNVNLFFYLSRFEVFCLHFVALRGVPRRISRPVEKDWRVSIGTSCILTDFSTLFIFLWFKKKKNTVLKYYLSPSVRSGEKSTRRPAGGLSSRPSTWRAVWHSMVSSRGFCLLTYKNTSHAIRLEWKENETFCVCLFERSIFIRRQKSCFYCLTFHAAPVLRNKN